MPDRLTFWTNRRQKMVGFGETRFFLKNVTGLFPQKGHCSIWVEFDKNAKVGSGVMLDTTYSEREELVQQFDLLNKRKSPPNGC